MGHLKTIGTVEEEEEKHEDDRTVASKQEEMHEDFEILWVWRKIEAWRRRRRSLNNGGKLFVRGFSCVYEQYTILLWRMER